MKILILDDREILFRAPAPYLVNAHDFREDSVVQISHPQFFWEEYDESFDEVWLDHDLALPGHTGEDVVIEIFRRSQAGYKFDPTFVLTSPNPFAVKRMFDNLTKYCGVRTLARSISGLESFGVHIGDPIRDRTLTLTHGSSHE